MLIPNSCKSLPALEFLKRKCFHIFLKTASKGAERWLLLQRTSVQFPVPIRGLTTVCNSSPRGSDALFWPLQALHTCQTQTYLQANITYNKSKYKPQDSNKASFWSREMAQCGPKCLLASLRSLIPRRQQILTSSRLTSACVPC